MEVNFNYPYSLIDVSKRKRKMKTWNTMAFSYRTKATSIENKRVPFFACLPHGVQYLSPCLGFSQSFSDNSNLIILVNIQHLHEKGKYF